MVASASIQLAHPLYLSQWEQVHSARPWLAKLLSHALAEVRSGTVA